MSYEDNSSNDSSNEGGKPVLIMFAGPNGSGKSTVVKAELPKDMFFINANDIDLQSLKNSNSPN